jgi:hypothetical protein
MKYECFVPYDPTKRFEEALHDAKKAVDLRIQRIKNNEASTDALNLMVKRLGTKKGKAAVEDALVAFVRDHLRHKHDIDAHVQGSGYPFEFRLKVYRRSVENCLIPSVSLQVANTQYSNGKSQTQSKASCMSTSSLTPGPYWTT